MIKGLGKIYKIFGFYMYGGRQNDFTGVFNIDSGSFIRGKIWDPNSRCSEHQVEGGVKQEDNENSIILEFVKIPTGMLVDIYYRLKKTTTPINELAGEYKGNWSFKEEVIPIVEGTEGETENSSRITLKEEKIE